MAYLIFTLMAFAIGIALMLYPLIFFAKTSSSHLKLSLMVVFAWGLVWTLANLLYVLRYDMAGRYSVYILIMLSMLLLCVVPQRRCWA